jgi:Glucodextranase, domain B
MTDRFTRTFLTLCVLTFGVGYAGYALYPSFIGPTVAVVTPRQFALSESGGLTLTGSAQHFSSLTMNGRRVITRTDGTFEERMLLSPGSNTFILEATDSFGIQNRQEVTVVYTPREEPETETARILPLEETIAF